MDSFTGIVPSIKADIDETRFRRIVVGQNG